MASESIAFDVAGGRVLVRAAWPEEIEVSDYFLADADPRYVTVDPQAVNFSVDNGCASYWVVGRSLVRCATTCRRVVGIYRETG